METRCGSREGCNNYIVAFYFCSPTHVFAALKISLQETLWFLQYFCVMVLNPRLFIVPRCISDRLFKGSWLVLEVLFY